MENSSATSELKYETESNDPIGEPLRELISQVEHSDISSIKLVVQKILKIIHDPASTAKDLKEVIALDPPLAAKVLRFANSAYYARLRRVTDIEKAVIWIGYDTLKELALSQKVCELFQEEEELSGYSRLALWKHSVAVAITAKLIYRYEFGDHGDQMYALGLLHDIGFIIEDQLLHDHFQLILERSREEKRSIVKVEQDVLGFDHTDIGRLLVREWKLPGALEYSIGAHHSPENIEGEYAREARTLALANIYCQKRQIGYVDTSSHSPETLAGLQRKLSIYSGAMEFIMDDVEGQIARLEEEGWFHND